MNACIVALAFFLAQIAESPRPLTISGTVADRDTSRPIQGAAIELSSNFGTVAQTVTTGPEGQFAFAPLAVSAVTIYARAAGYVSTEVGGRVETMFGNPPPIRFVMTPTGTISGRVSRGDGKPVSGIAVEVLKPSSSTSLQHVLQVTTDSSGDYQARELPPGQYFVAATDRGITTLTVPVSVFFPGVREVTQASLVELHSGEKLIAVDIIVTDAIPRGIRGVVIDDVTGRPAQSGRVLITPRHGRTGVNGSEATTIGADGSFSFPRVLPGAYSLMAILGDSQSVPAGRWRLVPIDVGSADITDARIVVTAGIDIPGKVVLEGSVSPGTENRDPSRIIAALLTISSTQFEFMHSAAVYASQGSMDSGILQSVGGEFTLKKAQPGDYQLLISGLYCCGAISILGPSGLLPPYREPIFHKSPLRGVYVRSVTMGGVDAIDGRIHVDPSSGPLEIRLGTNPAIVEGRALNDPKPPATDVTFLVMPSSLKQRGDLYHYLTTSASGGFRLEIAPGDYRVFAFRGLTEGIWMQPAFLRLYENRGTPLHVEPGGRADLDLQVIDLSD